MASSICVRMKVAETRKKELQDIRGESNTSTQYAMKYDENGLPIAGIAAFLADIYKDFPTEKNVTRHRVSYLNTRNCMRSILI